MMPRAIAIVLACSLLAACSPAASGSLSTSAADGALRLPPHAVTVPFKGSGGVVNYAFHNHTERKLEALVLYRYPILPWVTDHEACVGAGGVLTHTVKFLGPYPKVAIKVLDNLCGDAPHARGSVQVSEQLDLDKQNRVDFGARVTGTVQLKLCQITKVNTPNNCAVGK